MRLNAEEVLIQMELDTPTSSCSESVAKVLEVTETLEQSQRGLGSTAPQPGTLYHRYSIHKGIGNRSNSRDISLQTSQCDVNKLRNIRVLLRE